MNTSDSFQRIKIYYLVFGTARLLSGEAKIREVCERCFNLPLEFIYIDNAVTYDQVFEHRTIFAGDNSVLDFSGWEEGLHRSPPRNDELLLFVNDSFNVNYGAAFLDFLTTEKVKNEFNIANSAIGYVDDFPKPASLLNLNYHWWIRSNFFFLTPDVLERLDTKLVFPLPDEEIFSTPPAFWSNTTAISENFKAYISSWLFGSPDPKYPEYQLVWKSAEPLTSDNFSQFKKKARAILSEHYLGARLSWLKVEICNFNLLPQNPLRHVQNYYEQQPGLAKQP